MIFVSRKKSPLICLPFSLCGESIWPVIRCTKGEYSRKCFSDSTLNSHNQGIRCTKCEYRRNNFNSAELTCLVTTMLQLRNDMTHEFPYRLFPGYSNVQLYQCGEHRWRILGWFPAHAAYMPTNKYWSARFMLMTVPRKQNVKINSPCAAN